MVVVPALALALPGPFGVAAFLKGPDMVLFPFRVALELSFCYAVFFVFVVL